MEKNKRKGSLGTNLNFTPGDLEANKAGFISHRQQQRLMRRCVFSQEFLWYSAFTLFFIGTGISVVFNSSLTIWVRIAWSSIATLIGIGIGYGPLWVGHLQGYVQDYRKKNVLRVYRPQGQRHYEIGVSRYYVMSPASASSVLTPDKAYRLYIAEGTSTILSAEIAED